ncbi:MAG: hypothetical protein ACREQF_06925 [Candidatus Binataceae bacterium]
MRFSKLFTAAMGALAILSVASASAMADMVQWRQIVGIIQGGAIVGSGSGQVLGAPGPWSARGGEAHVDLSDGQFQFIVRGLVLAASNGIGTTGPVGQVKGTLVCDTDGSAGAGNSVIIESDPVALSSIGNAKFSGAIGDLPSACTDEPDIAFLVRGVGGPEFWLGNGAIRVP